MLLNAAVQLADRVLVRAIAARPAPVRRPVAARLAAPLHPLRRLILLELVGLHHDVGTQVQAALHSLCAASSQLRVKGFDIGDGRRRVAAHKTCTGGLHELVDGVVLFVAVVKADGGHTFGSHLDVLEVLIVALGAWHEGRRGFLG